MKIIFATNNAHKLEEVRAAVGARFEIVSLADIGFDEEIPETGDTLEDNSMQKTRAIYDRFHLPVFADDSGLEIDALDGRPGVHSAHYSGGRDASANMAKVLEELYGAKDRSARFRTVISFISKSGEPHLFSGTVEGSIAMARKGEKGFGYDPIFLPEGSDLSFAQMSADEKKAISHRARAVERFVSFLGGDKLG